MHQIFGGGGGGVCVCMCEACLKNTRRARSCKLVVHPSKRSPNKEMIGEGINQSSHIAPAVSVAHRSQEAKAKNLCK